MVVLPGPWADPEEQQQARARLLAEAWRVLALWSAGQAADSLI